VQAVREKHATALMEHVFGRWPMTLSTTSWRRRTQWYDWRPEERLCAKTASTQCQSYQFGASFPTLFDVFQCCLILFFYVFLAYS